LNCNKTIEFEDNRINELGREIAEKLGVEIVDMQFQIFANCPSDGNSENRKHRQ
jgi:Fe2+ or Zn2+ uptake regulation protein